MRDPLGQQPRLQPEHLRMLLGLGVVVAEQVQDPMGQQQGDLVLARVPGRVGLALRHLGVYDEVAARSFTIIALKALATWGGVWDATYVFEDVLWNIRYSGLAEAEKYAAAVESARQRRESLEQMRALQERARAIVEQASRDVDLVHAECRFRRVAGRLS